MDYFRLLSFGASIKKNKDESSDFPSSTSRQKKLNIEDEKLIVQIKKETDFFKSKKNSDENSIKKIAEKQQIEDEEEEEEIPPPIIANKEDARILRKSYKANLTGDDIPLPVGSFNDLITRFDFDRKLLVNLKSQNFQDPTPIQSEAIPILLHNRELIACAPTGSGKTLAFVIPLIQLLNEHKKNHGIRGLVISPTKELATQIFNECVKLTKGKDLKVAILDKTTINKLRHTNFLINKYDILISTPLRLVDSIKEELVSLATVERLIFDEADKLFEQGFLEQTDNILASCTLPTLKKSLFSATIHSGVEQLANSIMHWPVRVIIGHKEAANDSIEQKLTYCGTEQGKLIAVRQMIQEGEFKPPVLIFVQSVERSKALFHELMYDKLNIDVINADRTQRQRDQIIERFRNGDIWVLICTDVLARGIDFKGINLVINYDVPQSSQAYVHRIGRTGRAGRKGKAVTFYTKDDMDLVKNVVNVMKESGSKGFGEWMLDMKKLSKNDKKNFKKSQIDRKRISTVPRVIKNKRKKRSEMIEASKKRKLINENEENLEEND